MLLVADALASEGVVRLPVGCHRGGEYLFRFLHRSGIEQLAEARLALKVEVGELREADVREVLWAQAKESP